MSFHFQQRRGRGRHHSISTTGSEDIEPRRKKGKEEGRKVFIPSLLDRLPRGHQILPGCQGVCPLQEDELSICSLFPARKCPRVSPCKDRMTLLGTRYVLQTLILTKRKDLAKMEMSTGPRSQKAFLGKLSGWTDWLLGPSSEPASAQEMVTAFPRNLVPYWCDGFGEKRIWRAVGPWRSNSNVSEWTWKKQPGNQKCWPRVSPSTGGSELLLTGSPLWPLGCVGQLEVPPARCSSTQMFLHLTVDQASAGTSLPSLSSVLLGHRLCLSHLKNFWSLGSVTLSFIPQA